MRIIVTLCLILPFFGYSAYACKGLESEDYVLLDNLPDGAQAQDIIAQVAMVSPENADYDSAQVRVKKALKGVKIGDVLQVRTSGSSCSFIQNRMTGEYGKTDDTDSFFIAGEMRKDDKGIPFFIGSWRAGKRIH